MASGRASVRSWRRVPEKTCTLADRGQARDPLAVRERGDGVVVVTTLPAIGDEQSGEQRGDGGLAGPGRADDRDGLAGLRR